MTHSLLDGSKINILVIGGFFKQVIVLPPFTWSVVLSVELSYFNTKTTIQVGTRIAQTSSSKEISVGSDQVFIFLVI
uniref:Uncharacterized protein n=1 Tax=Aegilops tauschii subsp. strangulata TaxID=200361 RepID=A0A453HKV7_AEGTS